MFFEANSSKCAKNVVSLTFQWCKLLSYWPTRSWNADPMLFCSYPQIQHTEHFKSTKLKSFLLFSENNSFKIGHNCPPLGQLYDKLHYRYLHGNSSVSHKITTFLSYGTLLSQGWLSSSLWWIAIIAPCKKTLNYIVTPEDAKILQLAAFWSHGVIISLRFWS